MDETKGNGMEQPHARANIEIVVALLLAGKSLNEISEHLEIGRTSLWRLRQSEVFQRAYREAKDVLLSKTVDSLHRHAVDFVEVLHRIAIDDKCQPSSRVMACREGLTALCRTRELFDLSERLKALEGAAGSDPMNGNADGGDAWLT